MKRFVLATLLTCFLAQAAGAIDLQPAPAGFTWQEIPELKAAILRPDGWFFKKEEDKGTLAYFITKESIENGGDFHTGLTVNVSRLQRDSAVDRGRGLIEQLAEKHHADKWFKDVGAFKEFGCLTRDTDATGTSMVQNMAVANPKTNTLYVFIFESPRESWEAAAKIGQQIFNTLALDDGA